MTDKQIIIDGVDVKDCKRRIGKNNYCRYYKRPCAENNYNCIWKKYLRKEQECEEKQKTAQDAISKLCAEKSTLCNELDQLKAENEELKKYIKHLHNLCGNETDKQYKLKQTLTEIKEIAEDFGFNGIYEDCFTGIQKILQKISECEVNNE